MADIGTLSINIEADSSKAINSLDQLGEALRRLNSSNIDSVTGQISNMLNTLNTGALDSVAGGLTRIAFALERLGSISLDGVQGVTSLLSGLSIPNMSGLDSLTNFFSKLSNSDFTANLAKAIEPIAKLTDSFGKLSGGLTTAYSALMNVDKELQQKPKDADKATTSVKGLNTGFSKLGGTLKRIVLYRAIRAAITALINGMKEGLSNAYKFSKLVGYDLADSLDRMASASMKMKNQLGSAFGEVLKAIEPVVTKIFSWITQIANFVSRIMAIFNGNDTFLEAQDVEVNWEKGTEAVKEYKKQLLGLDELNVLSSTKSSAGKDAEDVSKYFKEVAVDSNISKGTFSMLKSAANALKKAVNAVVSLVSSEGFQKLLGLVADIIGAGFKAALDSFSAFCTMTEGILNGDWNEFWSGFDELGESLAGYIDSLGKSLSEFFGIDWDDFKTKLGVWVGDVLDGISSFFSSIHDGIIQQGMTYIQSPVYRALMEFAGIDVDAILAELGLDYNGNKRQTFGETFNSITNITNTGNNNDIGIKAQEYAERYSNKGGAGGVTKETTTSGTATLKVDVNSDGIIEAYLENGASELNRLGTKILGGWG